MERERGKQIVLAGGSGFLGQLLADHLGKRGWEPVVLTRRPSPQAVYPEAAWDARTPGDWKKVIDGAEAVVNLAGRSINTRFTPQHRREIVQSRVDATRAIGEAIASCALPPKAWLNASAATIYRHTLGPPHDETSTDFTSTSEVEDAFPIEVAREWEAAFSAANTPATRKVALRITLVLGTNRSGVFRTLRTLSRIGLGGQIGDGQQVVSWIHDQDFCRAVEFILETHSLRGPVNMAAPAPVSNAELMRTFRRVCGIPVGLPATRLMLRLGARVMGTEPGLLLKSSNVAPGKLVAAGFRFEFPKLEEALHDLEGRVRKSL